MTNTRRLYRKPSEGKLFGVVAGVADYFSLDVTLLRIITVVLALAGFGAVVLLYIGLAIFLPVSDTEPRKLSKKQAADHSNCLAIGLIGIGAWLLLRQAFPQLPLTDWNTLWPLALILIGVMMIVKVKR